MLTTAVVGTLVSCGLGAVGATPARAAVQSPATDPFYTYAGDLAETAPGTVLKSRSVTLSFAKALGTPISAEQLLYRTTNEVGNPALAVTTVIRPLAGSADPKIVSWQTAYDSLGPQCDPSYEFQGGSAGLSSSYLSGCDGLDQLEITGAASFLAQGATVVIPDYEETKQVWAAGQLEGYATLDSLRAVESSLKYAPRRTPVGMIGYSGGAIPSQWAAELAPTYAPDLDLVGTAAGGVLVDPYHNMLYVSNDGSINWSNVMPAVLLTIFGRGFGIPIYNYTSAYGSRLMSADSDGYVASFTGNMTYQELLKPQYADIGQVPAFASDFNYLIMGSDGTPRSPMLLANGGGTPNGGFDGDGVMITADVEALAHEYCGRGVPVEYEQYNGLAHSPAIAPFEVAAISYITERLTGLTAPSNCSTVGVGNSLAPLPVTQPTVTRALAPSCPAASGSLRGITLGRLKLGMTPARAAALMPRHSASFAGVSYCLTGATRIRAVVGSARLLAALPRAGRVALTGKIVLLETGSRHYAVGPVRPGASVAAAKLTAAAGWRAEPVAGVTWYLRRAAAATDVAVAGHGRVLQVGVMARALSGSAAVQRQVLGRVA